MRSCSDGVAVDFAAIQGHRNLGMEFDGMFGRETSMLELF